MPPLVYDRYLRRYGIIALPVASEDLHPAALMRRHKKGFRYEDRLDLLLHRFNFIPKDVEE